MKTPFTVYWEFDTNPHNLIMEEQMVVLQKQKEGMKKWKTLLKNG